MRVYLDFDGVINAPGCSADWNVGSVDMTDYEGFTLVWSERLVGELVEAVQRGVLELVWVTNWPSGSVEGALRMMGFGRLAAQMDVLEWGSDGVTGTAGMASAIVTHLFENPLSGGEMWAWLTSHSDEVAALEDFKADSLLATGGLMGYIPAIDAGVGLDRETLALLMVLAEMGSESSESSEGGVESAV